MDKGTAGTQVFHVVNLQMSKVKMKMTAVKWDLVVKAIAKIKCKKTKTEVYVRIEFNSLTVPNVRITYDLRCYWLLSAA